MTLNQTDEMDEFTASEVNSKDEQDKLKAKAPSQEDCSDDGLEKPHEDSPSVLLSKFTLYESPNNFYILGSNARETRFRVLVLNVKEEDITIKEHRNAAEYMSRAEVIDFLGAIENEGGEESWLIKHITGWALLGLARFTGPYYLCLVTKCSVVALLGGHYIYHVDETKLVPLAHSYKQPDRKSSEARLLSIFQQLDLSKTFYFSPSYDLTNTLQTNLVRVKLTPNQPGHREKMFIWNQHLLLPLLQRFNATMEWCQALVHGFIDQARISVFGNSVYITLIARRSHRFAGARFFKRGTNNEGYVANEVESEQIVSNQLSSSFHDHREGLFNSPRYTSYVQHRGSICLSWSQVSTNISPKPPIRLDAVDPYYSAAARHFDRLFFRYGAPIHVLNLVKLKERTPRESILAHEFENCIAYLNQFLPEKSRIEYTAWDMSNAAKGVSSEVMDYLERYAKNLVQKTGIFCNGSLENVKLQEGVCRTNCVDCVDRTNAAQSVIAKHALGQQLEIMGIIEKPKVEYDTDVMNLLTEMYHDHGDTLALQYGGSNLVNTVETYRKINQWSSHSRDVIESIRRFYSNSFVDAHRQNAINVFLGNYQYSENRANLWELATDWYLHNTSALALEFPRRSYRFWYTPRNLQGFSDRIDLEEHLDDQNDALPAMQLEFEHHWARMYRPKGLTTIADNFLMKMNSTERYTYHRDGIHSPFAVYGSNTRHTRRHAVKTTGQDSTSPETPTVQVAPITDSLHLVYDEYLSCDIMMNPDEYDLKESPPCIEEYTGEPFWWDCEVSQGNEEYEHYFASSCNTQLAF